MFQSSALNLVCFECFPGEPCGATPHQFDLDAPEHFTVVQNNESSHGAKTVVYRRGLLYHGEHPLYYGEQSLQYREKLYYWEQVLNSGEQCLYSRKNLWIVVIIYCITGNTLFIAGKDFCNMEKGFCIAGESFELWGTSIALQGSTRALPGTTFALRRTAVVLRRSTYRLW